MGIQDELGHKAKKGLVLWDRIEGALKTLSYKLLKGIAFGWSSICISLLYPFF